MGLFVLRGIGFSDSDLLPTKYSEEGEGFSPALRWRHVPNGTRYLSIHIYSLSASGEKVEHWSLYNIPPFFNEIADNNPQNLGVVGQNENGFNAYLPPDNTTQKTIYIEIHAYSEEVRGGNSLDWSQIFCQIQSSLIRTSNKLKAFYPTNIRTNRVASGKYEFIDLGLQLHHTYDPKIVDGVVLAGKDRCNGNEHSTTAAIWDGNWALLKDFGANTFTSTCTGSNSKRFVGHINTSQFEGDACFWDSPSDIELLPKPPNAVSASAYSVSNDGFTIVGECTYKSDDEYDDAIIWEYHKGKWTWDILPALEYRAWAVGLDETTKSVYGTMLGVNNLLAVKWTRNTVGSWIMSILALDTDEYSQIEAFSDGWAVGASGRTTPDFYLSSAAWNDQDVQLNSGLNSLSFFNDHYGGLFVGTDASRKNQRAIAWSKGGGKIDIHPPARLWSIATGIDKNGNIVGVTGDIAMQETGDNTSLFLLKPTP